MDFRLVSGVFRFGFWKTALYLLSLGWGGSTHVQKVPLASHGQPVLLSVCTHMSHVHLGAPSMDFFFRPRDRSLSRSPPRQRLRSLPSPVWDVPLQLCLLSAFSLQYEGKPGDFWRSGQGKWTPIYLPLSVLWRSTAFVCFVLNVREILKRNSAFSLSCPLPSALVTTNLFFAL